MPSLKMDPVYQPHPSGLAAFWLPDTLLSVVRIYLFNLSCHTLFQFDIPKVTPVVDYLPIWVRHGFAPNSML